jgi:hypothetical protein
MVTEETLSLNERKVVRWAQGLVVFITREAKNFEWDDKTRVKIAAVRDAKGEAIVIRKSEKR